MHTVQKPAGTRVRVKSSCKECQRRRKKVREALATYKHRSYQQMNTSRAIKVMLISDSVIKGSRVAIAFGVIRP
jgi:hypothetical protein